MDINRAKQILSSSAEIEVKYNGASVWLEDIKEKDATAKMREYFEGIEPSSPSMALLKGKEVIHFIPRHDIEDHSMEDVMENLLSSFEAKL